MKKIRVITCKVINQEWEYEVEVPDDFENNIYLNKYLLSKISRESIDGHCLDFSKIIDEMLVEWNEIEAWLF